MAVAVSPEVRCVQVLLRGGQVTKEVDARTTHLIVLPPPEAGELHLLSWPSQTTIQVVSARHWHLPDVSLLKQAPTCRHPRPSDVLFSVPIRIIPLRARC